MPGGDGRKELRGGKCVIHFRGLRPCTPNARGPGAEPGAVLCITHENLEIMDSEPERNVGYVRYSRDDMMHGVVGVRRMCWYAYGVRVGVYHACAY